MKRGTVFWINLEPSSPPEFGKIRPGLVVSNTEFNMQLPTVVVVPLSTQAPEIWPLRLHLKVKGLKQSFAVIPGMRQVSKARLQDQIDILSDEEMAAVNEAVSVYLK